MAPVAPIPSGGAGPECEADDHRLPAGSPAASADGSAFGVVPYAGSAYS